MLIGLQFFLILNFMHAYTHNILSVYICTLYILVHKRIFVVYINDYVSIVTDRCSH